MTPSPAPSSTDAKPCQGLDVAAHYDDCRRLICGHPSFRAAVGEGLDADELLQELLLRLIARQEMPSRWDPRRGSISKYVWVFVASQVPHLVHTHRQRQREQVPLTEALEQETTEHECLSWEAQVHRVIRELGLGLETLDLVDLVAAGKVRRDDGRVVALGQSVRRRMGG